MNVAQTFARRSSTQRVSAKDITDAGGRWDRDAQAYVFGDGSAGCFLNKPMIDMVEGATHASGFHRFAVVEGTFQVPTGAEVVGTGQATDAGTPSAAAEALS